MREAVCTLIYATSRTEIPELIEVRKNILKSVCVFFCASILNNDDIRMMKR